MSSSRFYSRYPVVRILAALLFLSVAMPLIADAQESPPKTDPSAGRSDSKERDGDKLKRFEVGVHGTIMFQSDFEAADVVYHRAGFDSAVIDDPRYESGFGGRFTYNINRNLAVETEVNYTPSTKTITELAWAGESTNVPASGGEKTQVLFGVKYGYRGKRFGVFGKARPGLIHFNAFPFVAFSFPVYQNGQQVSLVVASSEKPATFFNVDVGGVFEYYTSKRTMIRFDVGDTIIRYNAQDPKQYNPNFTRHNLQMNLGFGFRF
ncbi:MAG: porin family protein [Acidobacteria bacterium]|nr:porin family protein [Acidobacteriota bacterium]